MLTLHLLEGRDLRDGVASIGIIDPHPPGDALRVYDFGIADTIDDPVVVAVASGEPAGVAFAPDLVVERRPSRLAANRKGKVITFPMRRRRVPIPDSFVSGYEQYAAPTAHFWRDAGVGPQPMLAAGVFALSSIRTNIVTALKLFSMLTPYVLENGLPSLGRLTNIVRRSGAGLVSQVRGRPKWFSEYDAFRGVLVAGIQDGWRDDELRRLVATTIGLPIGLGLAKLSFTLALVGQNLGCLDARIIDWAFSKHKAREFIERVRKRGSDGTFSDRAYDTYRKAELEILQDTPFYQSSDPVALARSQWMLWESLGPAEARTHTHEELYAAVNDPRLLFALGGRVS